ncbi:MAG: serine/threonine protein kinase [Planctomycetia bacterium]|nr:serine/threonine protein kinase [Planctomycetia bacterium]
MQPAHLGPYTITASLGRGGMGAVYEAVDQATGRDVAVKTLAAHLGDDPGLRKRFAAEIETLKALRHPCIVQLLAFGEDDGQPFFAMELVRGRSLEQLLRSGRRFTWRETVDMALDITRALKSAHDHGVVHRDLKPANLIIPDQPAPDAGVKLADFGIARLFGGAGQTMAGMIVGTVEYMAPEQAAGGPVDHRVDLYALGLVMFAMLTGRPPFQGGQPTEVIQRQKTEIPPRVSTRGVALPASLDDLIERLLAKDPAKRPASALAVGRALAALATQTPPTPAVAADHTAPAAVDLLAQTEHFPRAGSPGETAVAPAVISGGVTDRDVPADAHTMPMPTKGAALAQRLTEPATDGSAATAAKASRFTTVEDLQRVTQADAAARLRRENRFRAFLAILLAAVVTGGGYLLLRPPTADELHNQIMAVASGPDADLRDARPLIDRFLARHPDDPRADAVRGLDRGLDLDMLERRARRRRMSDGDMPSLEREYRAAMAREDESPVACIAALEAILVLHADARTVATPSANATVEDDPSLWLALVRRQIDKLGPRADLERAEDISKARATLAEAETLATQALATAERATRDRLLERRRSLLEGLVEIYAQRPHVADAVDKAKALLAAP